MDLHAARIDSYAGTQSEGGDGAGTSANGEAWWYMRARENALGGIAIKEACNGPSAVGRPMRCIPHKPLSPDLVCMLHTPASPPRAFANTV